MTVPTAGLVGYFGADDGSLINGDWAYDVGRDRFYVVRHMHPMPAPSSDAMGNNVPFGVQVAALEPGAPESATMFEALGDIVPHDDGGNSWMMGYDRNHNAGLVRDGLGHTVDSDAIEVAYTSCNTSRMLFGRTIFTVRAALDETLR